MWPIERTPSSFAHLHRRVENVPFPFTSADEQCLTILCRLQISIEKVDGFASTNQGTLLTTLTSNGVRSQRRIGTKKHRENLFVFLFQRDPLLHLERDAGKRLDTDKQLLQGAANEQSPSQTEKFAIQSKERNNKF